MKNIGLAAVSFAAMSCALIAQPAFAQSTSADDDLIEIGGDRSARPAIADVPAIDAPVESPSAISVPSDPVGMARKRAPMALTENDELLLDRLKSKDMVHRLRGIDVPFRLLPPQGGQPDASIWHKGPMPSKTLLARLRTTTLSEAATTIATTAGETGELRLAEASWRSTGDPKPTYAQTGLLYCARDAQIGGRKTDSAAINLCLVDEDRDGIFDAYMGAEGDAKGTVHSLYLVGPPLPLAAPLAYTVDKANSLVSTAEWHTCGKDWDLPYFRPYLLEGEVEIGAPSRIDPRRQGTYCDKAELASALVPVEKGATTAKLGALGFEIGSKRQGAKATVRELYQPDQIYREEDGKVVPMSVGMTPTHVQLATAQEFDQRPYKFNGDATLEEAKFGKGDVFLTMGFDHGYTGVVTADIKIRTLLSSRTVSAGTPVYGVPAEQRQVLVNYYGGETILGPPIKRAVNTAIVWCLPVREEEEVLNQRREPTGEIKIIWSATCLPTNSAGNHTVLKDQSPALAVRNMRMDAAISTNDGPPPVNEAKVADFGAPMSFRYRVSNMGGRLVTLTEELMLGDEVTSTKEVLTMILGSEAPFTAGGGKFLLKIVEGKETDEPVFQIEKLTDMQVGESAPITGVDFAALLRALAAQR
ncbi:hypothetical protein GCM10023115_14410 [Pontixanthobacter gangjinensis]|uniref:Secreted protein n=1 Tax=Pontixanthobacter gangjinensis TaxID=1028742 RepID=A0A6I4SNG0_9SPHN|nr:hypothetical protein [Pontixanthobacter gangjinensis]MXO56686.1 hypothetical protein [Pontixanthobacter gangjinensis]